MQGGLPFYITRENIAMKLDIQRALARYFLFFFLYSVIGWLYEVFLEVVVYRWGFSNRGVLFGPYCVIYGVGALLILLAFGHLKRTPIRLGRLSITPVLVFLGIVVLTTALELLGSYIMEATQGSWLWDYRRYAFNFQGRIALNPSIRFGIGGMVFLYLLQPLFEKLADHLPRQSLIFLSCLLAVLMLADCVQTFFL